jgi:hypothetical protein
MMARESAEARKRQTNQAEISISAVLQLKVELK